VFYLTPLSGADEEIITNCGLDPREAFYILERALCLEVILVGCNPHPDVKALGLRKGKYFKKILDLRRLWHVWSPTLHTYTRFSLGHLMRNVLNIQPERNVVSEALNCVGFWNRYIKCRIPDHKWKLRFLRRQKIKSPRRNPS